MHRRLGIGGLGSLEEQHSKMLEKGPDRVSAFFIPQMITNLAPGQITMKYGIKGPSWSTMSRLLERRPRHRRGDASGCGAATGRLDDRRRRRGHRHPVGIGGFEAMKALSTRNDEPEKASRPFDRGRDGFVMGEGAGILVLEELAHAKKRGAKIYAELAGYGARRRRVPHHPPGARAARARSAACSMALKDARLRPTDRLHQRPRHLDAGRRRRRDQAIKKVFGDARQEAR